MAGPRLGAWSAAPDERAAGPAPAPTLTEDTAGRRGARGEETEEEER